VPVTGASLCWRARITRSPQGYASAPGCRAAAAGGHTAYREQAEESHAPAVPALEKRLTHLQRRHVRTGGHDSRHWRQRRGRLSEHRPRLQRRRGALLRGALGSAASSGDRARPRRSVNVADGIEYVLSPRRLLDVAIPARALLGRVRPSRAAEHRLRMRPVRAPVSLDRHASPSDARGASG